MRKPPDFFVPHPNSAPKKLGELSLKEQELTRCIPTIGGDDRENKVIDLLLEQAKRLADHIVDADVWVARAERNRSGRNEGK